MQNPDAAMRATRRLAAYHEAGHAVACHFRPQAGSTIRVSIRAADLDEGDAGLHACRQGALPGGFEQARASAVVSLAGAEVDRRLTGGRLTCGEADYRAVRELLARAFLEPEIEKAVAAVSPEEVRAKGLERIASEASAELEAQRARLFEELRSEARELVSAKWRHVEAVAEALLVRGHLSGDEVASLVARVDRTTSRRSRVPVRPRPPSPVPTR